MTKFRLKPDHEFVKKVEKLEQAALELGIRISIESGNCRITDLLNNKEYRLEDLEHSTHCSITNFPYELEWLLTFHSYEEDDAI